MQLQNQLIHSPLEGLNGLGVLFIIVGFFILLLFLYYIERYYKRWKKYENYYHRDDNLIVKPEQLLPYDLKHYNLRIGNTFIKIYHAKPKSLDNKYVSPTGFVTLQERRMHMEES